MSVITTVNPRIIHAESKHGDDIAGEKRNRLARESGLLRLAHPKYFSDGDPLYHKFLHPYSHRFEPAALPAQPLGNSTSGLIYTWTNPNFLLRGSCFTIYVHWDPNGEVRPDIFEQLKEYSNHSDIVFVSASPKLLTNLVAMDRLKNICDFVLFGIPGLRFWQLAIRYFIL